LTKIEFISAVRYDQDTADSQHSIDPGN